MAAFALTILVVCAALVVVCVLDMISYLRHRKRQNRE